MKHLPDGTIVYFPITDGETEIAAAWYVELPGPGGRVGQLGNIMAMVMRDLPTAPWKLVARTRFYRDADLTTRSKDQRSGYMVQAKPEDDPETVKADLVAKTDAMFQAAVDLGGQLTKVDGHKDLDEFLAIWEKQPWAHMTKPTGAEAEKYGRKYS